jgi:acylglycerol lipase
MDIKEFPSGRIALYKFDISQPPKAVILLVHGLGEHAGRYSEWAARFNEEGISCRSFDLPGHGLSEGRRGAMPPMEVVYDIIDSISESIIAELPGVPLFIYGQSLGGSIVLNYLIRHRLQVRGAIVTSPWIYLSEEPPKVKVLLASIAKKIMPGMTQSSGLKSKYLSHNKDVVEAYRNDPLVHGMISVGLYCSVMDAARETLIRASEITVPLLLVHGRDDMITSPSGSVRVAEAVPEAMLKLWDGGYHELHNDLVKDEHFAFITEWIETLL